MSKIEVDTIDKQSGSTLTLGGSGTAVTLGAGATQSGFGRTGTVDWDTTPKTASFTAVSGVGYFVNTTSGAITVTLPASPSAGNIVAVADYAGTAATNAITLARNGSNINGSAADITIQKNNSAIFLVYVDATQGWKNTETSNLADIELQPAFVTATGGTETTCGNFKIHTFTGPGTFTVSCAGNPLGSETVDYLVVAGGGGAGSRWHGGGGGAGGFRESSGTASGCYTASPLGACVSALPVAVQGYPVTVGGGGAGGTPSASNETGSQGDNSIFSTITSTGGGAGLGFAKPVGCGSNGGSGGGGGASNGGPTTADGGSGNTPPVSPPQGQPGGTGEFPSPNGAGGGGGGAICAGSNATNNAGPGGDGATSSINGTATARAGGGAGSTGDDGSPGTGGDGGGGNTNAAGAANTGGGGGSIGCTPDGVGNTGGSGIVIIRYKFQ
jgi:hypothetical protein